MKKLLCPIDFSEVSLNALEFAVAIAEKEQSEITLLNIFTRSDFNKILDTKHLKEDYDKLLEIARAKLEAIAKEIYKESAKKGLASCNYEIKSGKIIDIVCSMADEEKYDLIVMGTTGHSAYERKYLGGKAESIIKHTHCSVLCVPEDASFHGIGKIIYATDYQEEDKLAIQQLHTHHRTEKGYNDFSHDLLFLNLVQRTGNHARSRYTNVPNEWTNVPKGVFGLK